MLKVIIKYTLLIGFIFVAPFIREAKSVPPNKWPCDQVYNPQLNLTSIWQGPSIEVAIKDWWKHDDVIEYVNLLAEPTLDEEKGKALIKEFAKQYTYAGIFRKAEQEQKLIYLFAGLYQKAKDRRSRQYKGIIKFVERQEELRKAIGKSSKLLRKYRKEKLNQKNEKYVSAASQLEWNTRVFDQRTRLTEYVCEEPVFNTERLGYQSREIFSYLK